MPRVITTLFKIKLMQGHMCCNNVKNIFLFTEVKCYYFVNLPATRKY